MFRTIALALGLALYLASPCSAALTLLAGEHVFHSPGEATFPILVTSDANDGVIGLDLYLVMDPAGPLITNVDLIHGTIFESNNIEQLDFGLAAPEFLTPSHQPAYFTATASGSVPAGIVAFVTVDFTGIAPGTYSLGLYNEILGTSGARAPRWYRASTWIVR